MLFIFSTQGLIRHLWQIKTVVFLQWCLIYPVPLNTKSKPVKFSCFAPKTFLLS